MRVLRAAGRNASRSPQGTPPCWEAVRPSELKPARIVGTLPLLGGSTYRQRWPIALLAARSPQHTLSQNSARGTQGPPLTYDTPREHHAAWSAVPERVLPLGSATIDAALTLDCGQAFRWRQATDGAWIGVAIGRVWRLRFGPAAIRFQAVPATPNDAADLARYFRLEVDLTPIAAAMLQEDDPFAEAACRFPGLRVLAQAPDETLLTFICSGANNIARITKSIDRLCRSYGRPIAQIGDETFCDFPSIEALTVTDHLDLRFAADLGFRARFLCATAARLRARGDGWLDGLRDRPLPDAQAALLTLPGVGPKVADCALLFGLHHDEAVPIDTHIRAAVQDLLGWDFGARSLTGRVYQAIGDRFRERYGPWAGWAQQYLFHLHRARARGEIGLAAEQCRFPRG